MKQIVWFSQTTESEEKEMDGRKKLLLALMAVILVSLACSFGGDEEAVEPPVVVIVLPNESDAVSVGQLVNVVVSITSDVGVGEVELLVNGQVTASEDVEGAPTSKSLNFEWVPSAEGAVVLAVIAYDTDGVDSEPAMVTVQVAGAGSGQPEGQQPTATEEVSQGTVVCTPPPCGANESYYCPGSCPGGCGITCATFTPTNPPPSTATFTPHPPTSTFTPTPTNTSEWVIPSVQIIVSLQVFLLPTVEMVYEQISIPAGEIGYTTATCPENSVVVSGGFAASYDVLVYTHSMDGNGWRAYARNNAGASKLLNVYAQCLKNTNGATTQYFSSTQVGAGQHANVEQACPAGSIVTGGGYASYSSGDLTVYNSSMSGNGWQVWADNNVASSRQVNVYAVCLSDVDATTYSILESFSIPAGSTNGGYTVCPEGELAVGGGFAAQMEYQMYNSSPGVLTTQWAGYAYNPTGEDDIIFNYAICMAFD
jgi:hypothetical protein